MRSIAMGAALLALSWAATTRAAPKPLLVWLYGDGESGRMLSELKDLAPEAVTKIKVRRKSPMESSGPVGLTGPEQNVANRLWADLNTDPDHPDLIHIGYSGSALTWLYCGSLEPTVPTNIWKPLVQQYAANEATAIDDAADLAHWFGFRVLLTKGPGAASFNAVTKAPLLPITPKEAIARQCMADAFFWVSFFLATLNTYEWVDYSGMTVDPRLGGAPVSAWQLNPTNVWHWEQDGVHISTNRLKYDGLDPPKNPIVPYVGSFTVGSGPGQVPQASLGAYRAAQNVKRAYQTIQGRL